MLFNSWVYWLFLPIVLAVYYPLKLRGRTFWLLLSSYVFYAWWDWRFLALFVGSTAVDYLCGEYLDKRDEKTGEWTHSPARRKRALGVSLLANLGSLAFFSHPVVWYVRIE